MKKTGWLAIALIAWGGVACAQEDPHGLPAEGHGVHAPPHGGPVHLDARYRHDHYYPPRGYAVSVLPVGSVRVAFGGGAGYYFHGGVWFRPEGGRYIVVTPPIGIVVPLLPSAYTTVWVGGIGYYYANGTYYAPAPGGGGYAVVAPPPGADAALAAQGGDAAPVDDGAVAMPVQPSPPPSAYPAAPPSPMPSSGPVPPAAAAALPDPIFYPRNGQTQAQTETDRRACNGWATTQPNAVADASVFQRAVSACMDGRGYTVR